MNMKTKAQSVVVTVKGSSIVLSIGSEDWFKLVSLVNSTVGAEQLENPAASAQNQTNQKK